MKALLLFTLYAGLFEFQFARDRLQTFRCVPEQLLATIAQKNCTNSNESLITLFDREDVDVVSNRSKDCVQVYSGFWTGLRKKNRTRSTWSDGTEVVFNESSVEAHEFNQICEALDNGTWTGFNCSERKSFMCNTSKYTHSHRAFQSFLM
uniref:C-type lectin domain-containing protein n=1 Tax=Oryzias melastigma TaxID=30732 RepID=A0A3B3BYD9_ORYME